MSCSIHFQTFIEAIYDPIPRHIHELIILDDNSQHNPNDTVQQVSDVEYALIRVRIWCIIKVY